jgi:hypothetical protein
MLERGREAVFGGEGYVRPEFDGEGFGWPYCTCWGAWWVIDTDCLCVSCELCGGCSSTGERSWTSDVLLVAIKKSSGLKPREPNEDGSSCPTERSPFILGLSVTVLVVECEDDGGFCDEMDSASFAGAGGGEGDGLSSSGFAIRNPPKDCERLISPFMVTAWKC